MNESNKNNAEVLYYLGMSYINSNQFTFGIEKLLESISIEPTFKRSLYLALALAFKKMGKVDEAIGIVQIYLIFSCRTVSDISLSTTTV